MVVCCFLVAITVVTVITIMINHTMKLEKISEDQNLTEVTSAGYLMAPFNSASIRKIYRNTNAIL